MKPLLEYTSTKPHNKNLWAAIVAYEEFDKKAQPFQAKVVSWIALQLTTNFPAAKTNIQKYLDGDTTLQKIMDGLSKSIEEKYNIALDFTRITILKYQNTMYSPNPELISIYTAVKTILTKDHQKSNVQDFLRVLFPNSEFMNRDIQQSIYEPFQPTTFTVQQRFSEMLTDDVFRTYFKPATSQKNLKEIIVKDEKELQESLQKTFLENLMQTGNSYYTLSCNYKKDSYET